MGGPGEWRSEDDPRGGQFGQRGGPYYGQYPGQSGYGGARSGYGGSGWGGQEEWHDYPQSSPYSGGSYSQYPSSSGPGGYGQYGGMYGGMGQQQRAGGYGSPYREQGSYRDDPRRGEGFMPRQQEWRRSGQEWSGGRQGQEWSGPGGGFERGYASGGSEGSATMGNRRSARGPKGYQRSDERIREDVCDRLIAADIECEEIEIKVREGEVTLLGTTRSGESRREIERLAETIPGVKDVTNQIRMKREDGGETSRQGSSQQSQSQGSSQSQGRATSGSQSGPTQSRTG